MARHGEMQEVELLDADAAAHDSDAHGAPEDDGRRPPRHHRRWFIAATAAVALVAGATQWVVTARENDTLARISELPDVLAPVDATLAITRRISPDDLGSVLGDGTTGELARAADGAQSYVWPAASGRSGWTAQLMGPTTGLVDIGPGHLINGSACQTPYGTDSTMASSLVCLVTDGGLALRDDGEWVPVPKTAREVVVLSTLDGSVRARWDVSHVESFIALPHGLIALAWADAGGTTVAGYDELSGTQRWTRTDQYPAGYSYATDATGFVSIFPVAGLIGYMAPSSGMRLLGQDGTLVRQLPAESNASGLVRTDGAGARVALEEPTAGGGTRTTFLSADGDPAGDVSVDGKHVDLTVNDGSLSNLLLTSDTRLHAWDGQSGTQRWQANLAHPAATIVLQGRVFVRHSLGVAALDGKTGTQLWEITSTGSSSPDLLMTDGRHVLVTYPSTGAGDPTTLVAYDPATGHEDFRADLPPGVDAWGPTKHHQLIGTDTATGEYVVLG